MIGSSDWLSVEPPQGWSFWITHFVIIAFYVQVFVFVVGLAAMLYFLKLQDIILKINNNIWPLLTTVALWHKLQLHTCLEESQNLLSWVQIGLSRFPSNGYYNYLDF